MEFPFGKPVTVLPRQSDGTFGTARVVAGCAVAPREELEQPDSSWPPLSSSRTVYAPPGTAVSSRDRVVVEGVTFEVDGDPVDWASPFTGARFGVVITLRRTDNWWDTTVSVRTYLGSAGFGPLWSDPAEWPANIAAVAELAATGSGDDAASQVTVRVPPDHDGTLAVAAFVPGSRLTVAGTVSTVVSTHPITRDGFTEFVEVSAR